MRRTAPWWERLIWAAPRHRRSRTAPDTYMSICRTKDSVAVVDTKTLMVTAHYDLGGQGGVPAALAFDVKITCSSAWQRRGRCRVQPQYEGSLQLAGRQHDDDHHGGCENGHTGHEYEPRGADLDAVRASDARARRPEAPTSTVFRSGTTSRSIRRLARPDLAERIRTTLAPAEARDRRTGP